MAGGIATRGAAVGALEAYTGLRGTTGCAEGDAKGSSDFGGAIDITRLFTRKLFIEGLVRSCLSDRILLEEYQPL